MPSLASTHSYVAPETRRKDPRLILLPPAALASRIVQLKLALPAVDTRVFVTRASFLLTEEVSLRASYERSVCTLLRVTHVHAVVVAFLLLIFSHSFRA